LKIQAWNITWKRDYTLTRMSDSGRNAFWYKIRNWEFWPWQLIYLPAMVYYVYLSFKARTPFFFWLSNPGIEGGGLLIESKWEIFKKLPAEYCPATMQFEQPVSFAVVYGKMMEENFHFPVILKPEFGERGWMVEKIEDLPELEQYVKHIKTNFLLQEYIDLPNEIGIFYYRYPDQAQGTISSIVIKDLLSVKGDGVKNVKQLMDENTRTKIHINLLKKKHKSLLNLVPRKGESLELLSIGNHCRGATFRDGTQLINEKLISVFNKLGREISGFYYGRFDIRYQSINSLSNGKDFYILELNGAKSEPAHIYQPGYPLFRAFKVIIQHWKVLYAISRKNYKAGLSYPSWKKGWAHWRKYRNHIKLRKEY